MRPMKITLRNLRGCERADVTLAPLALVAGLNGQGKTSLLQGVQSALLGEAIPPRLREQGATQKGADALVHRGADDGSVRIETDGGSVSVSWPACKVDVEGEAPPRASLFAAGAQSLVELGERDRAAALSRYLDALPSAADLARAMADAGYGDDAAGKVWAAIEKGGWDIVWGRTKKHGTELAGSWQQVTGEKYGSKKAADWKPEGWSEEDADATALTALVEQAEAALERTIARQAVAEANVEQLREQAGAIPDLEAQEKEGDAEVQRLQAEDHDWKIKQRPVVPALPMSCPSCNAPLGISKDGKSLEERSDAPGEQEIADAQLAAAEFEQGMAAAKAAFEEAYEKRRQIRSRLVEARQAATKLAKIGGGDGEAVTDADVQAARNAVEEARARLQQQKAFSQAHALHTQIARNAKLIAILAPEGLRRRKMADALATFNERLECLSTAAKWPTVSLDEGLQVRYGQEAYWQASDSHQWRARTVLQVAMAAMERASAVLIDGADILDPAGRNGLFALLKAAGVPALVCMTISRPDLVPDLAAAGLGQSLWIEKGAAEPISQKKEQAA